nr:unnamed protein product [Callosobruchus analis]
MNGSNNSIKIDKKSLGKRKSVSEKAPQEDASPPKRKRQTKGSEKKKDAIETPLKKTQQRKQSQGEIKDTDEKEKVGKQARRVSQKRNIQENEDLDEGAEKVQAATNSKKDKSTKTTQLLRSIIEFVTIEGEQTPRARSQDANTTKDKVEEKTDDLDFKVEVVSEKFLKHNIAYAKYVKESEDFYKVTLWHYWRFETSHHMAPKFDNEYERALYDESVALRVLETKSQITASPDSNVRNNPELFVSDIQMTLDDVKQLLCKKDIDQKNAKLHRLTVEANLVSLDAKIRSCLGLDSANPKEAIGHLEEMRQLRFDDIMLKKHAHVVEMVRRLRKYVGNAKEWNMPEESLNEFSNQAEKVRSKAEEVYAKFKVTKIEYRAVIKFLTKERLTPKIIKERLDGVYGRSSPSVVKEWAKRFRMGQEFLEDDERPGRPVEMITEDKVALVEELEVVTVPDNVEGGFWEAFSEVLATYRAGCKDMTEEQIQLLCAEPSKLYFLYIIQYIYYIVLITFVIIMSVSYSSDLDIIIIFSGLPRFHVFS